MSSPGARQRRRRQQYQSPRTRAEIVLAVGIGVGIVASTVLMIWLLRPGGLIDRQPRASWLVAIALTLFGIAAFSLRPKSSVKVNRKLAVPGALGTIVVVVLVLGLFWPGGLLRHTPTVPTLPSVPANTATAPPTSPSSAAPGTTAPGGTTTTKAGATTTTTPPTSTSSP